MISWAGYLAISVIGPTLRYSISWEEKPSPADAFYEKPVIYSFWHRAVFAGAWLWRNVGIAVMVSRSFDGEYIARTIEKLGFAAVRGSSSRGGAKALLAYHVEEPLDGADRGARHQTDREYEHPRIAVIEAGAEKIE